MGQRLDSTRLPLRSQVTCPNCWHEFPPEDILWLSTHPELQPDPLLDERVDPQRRFLPTRFSISGQAIDSKGSVCEQLACPKCHLVVPRALLEIRPLIVSILGAPSSGKSYYLASMTWQLRTTLRSKFAINFSDAEPGSNLILVDYEEKLFNNQLDDELVTLPKTEQDGDLYETVNYGDQVITYPKPFVFTLKPLENHPSHGSGQIPSRALCLYDNAGEHFLPKGTSNSTMATHHLGVSDVLLFLFDPTQHRNIREACVGKSDDPQISKHVPSHRQDLVLQQAASRVRNLTGLGQEEKTSRPLVIVVTKYDAWKSLLPFSLQKYTQRVIHEVAKDFFALDIEILHKISSAVRKLMTDHAAEVVNAAEGFSNDVLYIPVSALGGAPEVNRDTGGLGVRPKNIVPMWTELPILYALHQTSRGLVRSGASKGGLPSRPGARPPDPAPVEPLGGASGTDASPEQIPHYWPPQKGKTGS